ncbi:hypothetical protein CRG98_012109 [Punica granatum]|uniref:Uncharacterized protein n=1 Tax=Punica granatum TaxID=22663 RepID=A0A2I0KGA6_PUNGR|nr:hypothetical protein CRG98_012109 [Punica granatum]
MTFLSRGRERFVNGPSKGVSMTLQSRGAWKLAKNQEIFKDLLWPTAGTDRKRLQMVKPTPPMDSGPREQRGGSGPTFTVLGFGPASGSGPAFPVLGFGPAFPALGFGPASGFGPAFTASGSGPAFTAFGLQPSIYYFQATPHGSRAEQKSDAWVRASLSTYLRPFPYTSTREVSDDVVPPTKLKTRTIERITQYRCNHLPRTSNGFNSMHP